MIVFYIAGFLCAMIIIIYMAMLLIKQFHELSRDITDTTEYNMPMTESMSRTFTNSSIKFHYPILDKSNVLTHVQCANRVYDCGDNFNCDCSTICGNDLSLEKTFVEIGDKIEINSLTLKPGVYCLPRGLNCNRKLSICIYSNEFGWQCVSKYQSLFWDNENDAVLKPCFNVFTKITELDKNRLYDYLLDKPVNMTADNIIDPIDNLYEIIPATNMYRYRCKCDARDYMDNKMIADQATTLISSNTKLNNNHLICSSDHCLRNIRDNPSIGFDMGSGYCKCGTNQFNRDGNKFNDCINFENKKNKDKLYLYMNCVNKKSLSMNLREINFMCYEYYENANANHVNFSINVLVNPHSLYDYLDTF